MTTLAFSKRSEDLTAQLVRASGEIRELPGGDQRAAAQKLYEDTSKVLITLKNLRERDRQINLADLARTLGHTNDQAISVFVKSVTGVDQDIDYNPGRALVEGRSNQ